MYPPCERELQVENFIAASLNSMAPDSMSALILRASASSFTNMCEALAFVCSYL